MSDLPSAEQILQIDSGTELEVSEDYLDDNRHMNIRRYFDVVATAVWSRWREFGVDDAYLEEHRLGLFTAEHHLRYLRELRVGQRFSVHVRMLERSQRAAHAMAFLLNRSTMTLSFTFEATYVHTNLETRRAAPFTDHVAERFDAEIERLDELEWAAPVCGVMGVRRK